MDILELWIILERFVKQSFSARFQRLALRHLRAEATHTRTHTRARGRGGTYRGRAGGIKSVCDGNAQGMNKIREGRILSILH